MNSLSASQTMLSRNHSQDRNSSKLQWEDLNFGAPTIIAFANLCSRAMTSEPDEGNAISLDDLSQEARAILAAASTRGIIDIRASREPFDSAERFLAVCVEVERYKRKLFLDKMNPEQTVRFLEGFRQLCQAGLVFHHLQKDFSLSAKGFDMAKTLNPEDYRALLDLASEIDH